MTGKPPRVSLLALPQTEPSILMGVYDVLWSAGVVYPRLTGEGLGRRLFRPRIVGLTREPFRTMTGAKIVPDAAIGEVARTDILFVPTIFANSIATLRGIDRRAIAWIREMYDAGAAVYASCGGVMLLAEAGLLDGGAATIHWSFVRTFEQAFPNVRLYPSRALVQSGPGQTIVSSGGGSAWQDLVLYVVARHAGEAEAMKLAKVFHFRSHAEGLSPYAGLLQRTQHRDALVGRCQAWLAENYDSEQPIARLIARTGLPERTFARRFRKATGYAPKAYLQNLRIEESKQLLETTDMPVEDVAAAVGYADPSYMRSLFKRLVGITPAEYRRRFRLPTAHVPNIETLAG
ncbi:GlxA family transcriptional regulator [Ferruginivarius sediminum]|nr:helix-turn-helix domain-containing protein [Ferruginivarius sediminum]